MASEVSQFPLGDFGCVGTGRGPFPAFENQPQLVDDARADEFIVA